MPLLLLFAKYKLTQINPMQLVSNNIKTEKFHKLLILPLLSDSSNKRYLVKENVHGIISILLMIRTSIKGIKSGKT